MDYLKWALSFEEAVKDLERTRNLLNEHKKRWK